MQLTTLSELPAGAHNTNKLSCVYCSSKCLYVRFCVYTCMNVYVYSFFFSHGNKKEPELYGASVIFFTSFKLENVLVSYKYCVELLSTQDETTQRFFFLF